MSSIGKVTSGMGARRSLRLLPGIGTILLWASAAYAGGAASMKERHNQSDRQADSACSATPSYACQP